MAKNLFITPKTPLLKLQHQLFDLHQIEVWIKRDDLNHPLIQGNKLHKLNHNLQQAKNEAKETLLTFGGAYSNHIAAVAAAGKAFGFNTIGYIRGDELEASKELWSPTLLTAKKNGMQLMFLSRLQYRQKDQPDFLLQISRKHPTAYILPEGGTNILAVEGFQSLSEHLEQQCPNWTHLYTAVGTGGTLAGIVNHSLALQNRKILGVSTIKDSDYLLPQIQKLITSDTEWELLQNYHGGGYGKITKEISDCQHWFEQTFEILLDPIYTNKMVYAFRQQLQQHKIPPHSKVILYHSGGLQGRRCQP